MDSARFDRLVQVLGRERSRRGALGVLAAFVLAPAVAASPQAESCLPIGKPCSPPDAAKARQGRGKGQHRPSCTKCCSRKSTVGKDGKARCTCKGEGERCGNPAQCCGGQCRNRSCTGCPGDAVFCGGSCIDLQTSDQHCGSCENACTAGQRCQNGKCVCDSTSCAGGCCQNGTCHVDDDAACGTGGGSCEVCTLPKTCGGGGSSGQCGCTPTTCTAQGKDCGTIPNGCGGADLDCGDSCPEEDETCGGGGTPNVCGCLAPDTVCDPETSQCCNEAPFCCQAENGAPFTCITGCG